MPYQLISQLLPLYRWACILLCAWAVIKAGVALMGFLVGLLKRLFRWYYLGKVAIAAGAAWAYYFLYYYRGFTPHFFQADPPKAVVIFIVALGLPMAIVQGSDFFLLAGTPKKGRKARKADGEREAEPEAEAGPKQGAKRKRETA